MRIAVYSRKSKFTGKGESVENQIQMCKEHAVKFFNCSQEDFIIYEDEGFSGRNTDRPGFKHMLRDARNKKFDTIMCYRLDRISRNVSDFSQLIDELEKYGVSFISVREQFDTTKPMGRAMMYIASVFSQLERETIAERIRDNMLQLSKTGRWLGGTTPTGFISEMVTYREADGRELKSHKLAVVPEEARIISLIYEKFLELKSITKVEEYLLKNNNNTRNGAVFGRFSVRFILSNPVYATADEKLYKYLKSNDYEVYSEIDEFNGINGMMSYNKTRQSGKNSGERYRKSSEWVLAVGLHAGIVSSEVWIEAQELLSRNKSKAYRKVKSSSALLSGILRCAGCGSFMRPKAVSRLSSEGEPAFYYICELKEKSKKLQCDIPNANGNTLDSMLVSELEKLFSDFAPLIGVDRLSEMSNWFNPENQQDQRYSIEEKLLGMDNEIKNLVRHLSKEENSDVETALLDQLKKLQELKETLKSQLFSLDEAENSFSNYSAVEYINQIYPPHKIRWDVLSIEIKRTLLRNMIESLKWDGKELELIWKL